MHLRYALAAVLVTGCAANPPPLHAPISERGTLTVEHRTEQPPFVRREATTIAIIDLDTARPGWEILVRETVDESEDPPDRIALFVWRDGGLVRAFDAVIGNYGTPALSFPGDGTMRYEEDAWTACTRSGNRPAVTLDRVTLALDDADRLVEIGRAPVRVFDCGNLAG
jgi:hypothetical protein